MVRARRLVAGLVVAGLVAVAVALALAFVHGHRAGTHRSHHVEVAHDGAVALVHDTGLDVSSVHGLRAQPASRTRGTTLAVLAVGVVVTVATLRRLRSGPRPVVRAPRRSGPPPGRGPPTPRIA